MLTIITTCKGRVHHLKGLVECLQKQTVKDWKCLVVSYGCRETAEWFVNSEDIRFSLMPFRYEGFHLSHARNMGAFNIRKGWLLFLDADTIIDRDYIECIQSALEYASNRSVFFTGEPGCSGNCLVKASDFLDADKYDEGFEGWGAEDADLYIRLQHRCGLEKLPLPLGMVYQSHPESESDKFHSIKKWDAQKKNIQRLFSKYPKEWIVPEYIAPELVKKFI